MADPVKVFISYSWTTPNHEEWVINLAERLMADGVDVIIDKWNLSEGHDKYSFMESMVTSDEIKKVLMILDKKYSEKADDKSGGVGTETQIISPQIYANTVQEKFIPILTERDENGKEYLPTFLKSRIYIDLSSPDHFEINYEKLLRNIYQRPAYIKPKIGKAPTYLFEEDLTDHRTASIVRSFDHQYDKNPKKIDSLIQDFLHEYFESLKEYSISFTSRDAYDVGKQIVDNLNSYSILRNDFINFYSKISKKEVQFDIEILTKFLEKLPILRYPLNDRTSWSNYEFDNFRFIIHELFLYLIAIALKNENYKLVEELFNSGYFIEDKFSREKTPKRFDYFFSHIEIFNNYYIQTFSRRVFSPMADFIINRIPDHLNKDIIVEADLLCFYIARINNLRLFPITYIYKNSDRFDLFDRMISLRHFEKVKILFNVLSVHQMKELLAAQRENDKGNPIGGYPGSFEQIRPVYELIDPNKIGSTR